MQSIIDAAKQAAATAASAVGLENSPSHVEDDHKETLPANATASETKTVDSEALEVFEHESVRHQVLVKLRKLALEDEKHGLREVAALDLLDEDGYLKRGISYYHPKRFFTVTRPNGVDYIGEIEIEQGKSIHVRAHKAGPGNAPTFHSIDTRPSNEGGAVFKTGEPLAWFDY
ncbi:hypothetical protein L204_100308 [Cryptococcus depauperatus]|nr:hypothetical protein L204_02212 [Cryptococcus depauperatus CBS 7855]